MMPNASRDLRDLYPRKIYENTIMPLN
jgi:hypothetical protein